MTTPSTCPQILKTWTQFAACVPENVRGLFWTRAKNAKGQNWLWTRQYLLDKKNGDLNSSYVFQLVPVTATQAGTTQMIGGKLVQVGGVYEETKPRNLSEANMTYAAELLSEMPLRLVQETAKQTGVRQDINELELRAGVCIMVAGAATKANELLPTIMERAARTAGAAGSSFWEKFSSGFKKLFTHPGDWFQRVFVTEPGKAIAWAGRQLMAAATHKWARWIIDPLGVFRQLGAFFRELGHAMIEGSITAFEEQTFAKENAKHWQQVGIALGVVAPFLPPPFNIVALGLAAVFTAAGTAILLMYAQAERTRENDKRADALQARATVARRQAAAAKDAAALAAQLTPPETQTAILGPDQPAPVVEKSGIDFWAVALVASGLLIWGLYGKA